jgi:hypothetical protein
MEEMMKSEDKKAAVAAYKELATVAGIYAVRCLVTGQRWAGRTPDLSKIQNRLWFSLRQGNCPHRSLQSVWREQGAENFVLEEVERLADEESTYIRQQTLKTRLAHWCATLPAEAI